MLRALSSGGATWARYRAVHTAFSQRCVSVEKACRAHCVFRGLCFWLCRRNAGFLHASAWGAGVASRVVERYLGPPGLAYRRQLLGEEPYLLGGGRRLAAVERWAVQQLRHRPLRAHYGVDSWRAHEPRLVRCYDRPLVGNARRGQLVQRGGHRNTGFGYIHCVEAE